MRASADGAVLGSIERAVARGTAETGSAVIAISNEDRDALSAELLQVLVRAVHIRVGVVAILGAVYDGEVALEELRPAIRDREDPRDRVELSDDVLAELKDPIVDA